MGPDGWPFASIDSFPAADVDPVYNSSHVKDLYLRADPDYAGRFTVPVLWDKKNETIVNNESSEIIRIFNSAFNEFVGEEKAKLDFYPEELRKEIDGVNEWVYDDINSQLPLSSSYLEFFGLTFSLKMGCTSLDLRRRHRHIVKL
jgi:glutathionyl-hydroquinone reductase